MKKIVKKRAIKRTKRVVAEPSPVPDATYQVPERDRESTRNLARALELAFTWSDTPDGFDYWADIHRKLAHYGRYYP